MELYVNDKKIKNIVLKPSYTIEHIKNQLDRWLLPQGYSYDMVIYRSNGSVIPLDLSYNLYNNQVEGKIILTTTSSIPSISSQKIVGQPRSPGFSGNRNVDRMILEQLDDRDLMNACLTDKRINEICKDDSFWYNRYVKKFGKEHLDIKPSIRSWRNQYLTVIRTLDLFEREAEDKTEFFDRLFGFQINSNKPLIDNINPSRMDNQGKILYYHLNFGNSLTLLYTIDRYDEADEEDKYREYETDTYFTPEKIMKIISDFYQEPITPAELEKQQEEYDNPYSEDYTFEMAEQGKVKRGAMIENLFFEGLGKVDDNVYYLQFGS